MKDIFEGKDYSLVGFNCYTVCEAIILYLAGKEKADKIRTRFEQVAKISKNSLFEISHGIIGTALRGPLGISWWLISKLVNKIF